MNIKQKSVLIMLSIWGLLGILLLVFVFGYLLPAFEKLELDNASKTTLRLRASVLEAQEKFALEMVEWAGRNNLPDPPGRQRGPESLSPPVTPLFAVASLGQDGKILSLLPVPGSNAKAGTELDSYLKKNAAGLAKRQGSNPLNGLLKIQNKPLLATFLPLQTGTDPKSPAKFLLALREVDASTLQQWEDRVQSPIRLMHAGLFSALPPGRGGRNNPSSPEMNILVKDGSFIEGMISIPDPFGDPVFTGSVTMARDFRMKMIEIIVFFLINLGLTGAGLWILGHLLLNYFVIERVQRLRAAVSSINAPAIQSHAPLPELPGDEIGQLGAQINRLLGDLQKADEEIRLNREQLLELAALVEESSIAILICGADRHIQYANREAEILFSQTGSSPLRCTLDSLHLNPDQGQPPLEAVWQEAIDEGFWSGHLIVQNREAHLCNLKTSICAISGTSGGRDRYALFCLDVTNEIRLQNQLRQSQKMEAVGKLAGGIAHDYNNLLFIIRGHAQMALEASTPGSPSASYLLNILEASDKAGAITQQLLSFSRKTPASRHVLDIAAAAANLSNMVSRIAGPGVRIQFLPPPSVLAVRADRVQIDQLLMNLLLNARDAIGDHEGLIRVGVSSRSIDEMPPDPEKPYSSPRYVLLSVNDDGCGMDQNQIEHLFEPFYTTKAKGKGTGLGLATVYGIVTNHEGLIRVSSKPGQGSTFEVFLPQSDDPVEPVEPPPPVLRDKIPGTLLLFEDETMSRILLQGFFEQSGLKVFAAGSGEEGIDLFNGHREEIDLVLMDVILPGKNGFETAEILLQSRPTLPLIFMSGHTGENFPPAFRRFTLVKKPFDLNFLLEKIRGLLTELRAQTQTIEQGPTGCHR
ncbi:MAG: ATP-binding protein [Verrucomicrobiae bacterium]|nr:ATP-binding protein [Verrucomicrobiae bacterium]